MLKMGHGGVFVCDQVSRKTWLSSGCYRGVGTSLLLATVMQDTALKQFPSKSLC